MAEASTMSYWCRFCSYIYDPEEGDEVGGVPPGTPFEDLPEDWTCPVCGAPKSEFRPTDFAQNKGNQS